MTPPTQQQNASGFTLTLFGPLEVLVDEKPLPPVRSRKILWLLALLTLRQGRPVEREWLAGTLWPDADQTQAFANLRPALSQLRAALGCHASRLDAPNRHTLQLNLNGAEVDVAAFDAAIASKQPGAMERAIALYRGPLLEGCNEEWVFQERTQREQAFGEALQRLAESALHRGDAIEAATYLRRSVGIDPLSDSAHQSLMDALARSGDRNAALDLYRAFSERLRRELGAAPHEQTRALYHRLRKEARAGSQTGQITAVTTLNPSSPPAVTGHIPHPLTELIGREDERLEVAALLHRSRLVTLTGQGGIGKTRLSVMVAHTVSGEYSDGVRLVSLELLPLQDGSGGEDEVQALVQQIAAVLGIKEGTGRPLLPLVAEHLRSMRLLLVLDNCEHVLAASARIAAHLLRECLGLRILATSREALKVSGETVWAVPALIVPNPDHLPSGKANLARIIVGYEGVRLFAERAQAAHRTFAVTGDNAREIALLCWRLQGVPLALELAAARTPILSPAQILSHLDARPLDALTSPFQDVAPRHRTLRATLEWSYGLLPPAAQTFLADLGVFRGGWTLEAVQAICSNTDAVEMLTVLQDASFINVVYDPDAGGSRFYMLETVREFAGEVLGKSGRAPAIRKRHADYFAVWMETTDRRGCDFLDSIEREYANMIAALSWCSETDEIEMLVRLCRSTGSLWIFAGRVSEAKNWLESALRRVNGPCADNEKRKEQAADPEAERSSRYRRNRSLEAQALLVVAEGDWEAATELNLQVFENFLLANDPVGGRTSLYNASIYFTEFDLPRSLVLLEQCLPLERVYSSDGRANPVILSQLALLTRLVGQPDRATAFLAEAMELCREREETDRFGVVATLWKAGRAAMEDDDLPLAQERFETAIHFAVRSTAALAVTNALCGLAMLARTAGDLEREEAMLSQAIEAAGPEPRVKLMQRLQKERAEFLMVRGNTQGAAALVRSALAPFVKKAQARRFHAYPMLLILVEAELSHGLGTPARDGHLARLLGAATGMAARLGLLAPERTERERTRRLRSALTLRLGVEERANKEAEGTALSDEATLQLALTIV